MMATPLFELFILPLGLGLLGFIEPCSMGANLLFAKFLEGKTTAAKLFQVTVFTLARMGLIGLLGALAALAGSAFIGFQKAMWVVLGALYFLLGVAYLAGKAGALMRTVGPSLEGLNDTRGAAGLGLLFGLNIPACAAPLIFALLGMAATGGAGGETIATGFLSLAVFGLGLSIPLIALVALPLSRRALDWISRLSVRAPRLTGFVLVGLGLWSIGFAFFVNLEKWS